MTTARYSPRRHRTLRRGVGLLAILLIAGSGWLPAVATVSAETPSPAPSAEADPSASPDPSAEASTAPASPDPSAVVSAPPASPAPSADASTAPASPDPSVAPPGEPSPTATAEVSAPPSPEPSAAPSPETTAPWPDFGSRAPALGEVPTEDGPAHKMVAGALSGGDPEPINFEATGALIIPMDTDTSGNHTAFNQNLGMWKSFGLIYRLLENGIPVGWAIKEGKTSVVEIDISATNVHDKRTGTALGAWDYRGGPFIIVSADAPAALPIITAWWAAQRQPAERPRGVRRIRRQRGHHPAARAPDRQRGDQRRHHDRLLQRRRHPGFQRQPLVDDLPERPRRDGDRERRPVHAQQPVPGAQVRHLRHPPQQRLRLLAVGPDEPRHEDIRPARCVRRAGRRLDRAVPLDPEQREQHQRPDAERHAPPSRPCSGRRSAEGSLAAS